MAICVKMTVQIVCIIAWDWYVFLKTRNLVQYICSIKQEFEKFKVPDTSMQMCIENLSVVNVRLKAY